MSGSGLAGQEVENETLLPFLGDPSFQTQLLWGSGGSAGLVSAMNGHLIAFHSPDNMIRRSEDGGLTWLDESSTGGESVQGNVMVDEASGDILFLDPGTGGQGRLLRSTDNGLSWSEESVSILPDGFGYYPHRLDSSQAGITLAFAEQKGRLVFPARVNGPVNSDDLYWRPYHYGNAIYSDDHGQTWQTSKPFPVMGNAGASLAEIHDGSIMYNAREFMSPGKRFLAWSHNGGDLWLNASRSPDLPDGPGGSSYGCPGGLIRLPVDGYDILVYSNLDTDTGVLPDEPGGISTAGREKLTVWVSFDGGKTWPVKRLVFDGPAAGSVLAYGRTGTPSGGKIYLLYEGGETGNEGVHVAAFNLSWLLNGLNINDYLGEEYALWTIYDGSRLLTEYPEWSVETNGTAPPSGTCYEVMDDPEIPGNKLIRMEDLTDDWKEALQLNWGIDQTRGITIVFRSKATQGILDLQNSTKQKKYLYASPRNGTYFDALIIEETDVQSKEYALKLNQTSGYSVPNADFGWSIYRITMKEDSLNVYVNENPAPVFGADVASKNDNFLQFGNNSRAPFGAWFDWMALYYNGANAPGEGEDLPAQLTGLTRYTLSLETNPANAGEAAGEGEFFTGQQFIATASPKEGFEFESWTLDGLVIGNDTALISTMPMKDMDLTANFRVASGIEPVSQHYQVFPNPALDRVEIMAPLKSRVIVYDLLGGIRGQYFLENGTGSLDISHYPSGRYILKIISREGTYHVNLIKN